MKASAKRVALNRPVFSQRAFDSSALTVLTTLLHRFPEAGQYDVTVRRSGKLVGRLAVSISEGDADQQINIDMAKLGEAERRCGCDANSDYKLVTGGVMGFYASSGTGRYTVRVSYKNDKEKKKEILLDSSQEVPQGDFFAVTLVRPGLYRVFNTKQKGEGEVRVRLPKGENEYRPGQAKLVTLGKKDTIDSGSIEIFSGQSVVFHCKTPARIRAELLREDESAGEPIRDKTFRYRKPDKRPPPKTAE